MKDLISREALALDVRRNLMPNVDADGTVSVEDAERYFLSRIENAPAVDAVEVVHAKWEECDWVEYDGHSECIHYPKEALKCTNCCNAFKKKLLWKRNYCPNCGARMDGE